MSGCRSNHACTTVALTFESLGLAGTPTNSRDSNRSTSSRCADFDSAAILNFLRTHELIDHFKLNIEANHATLAGHTFEHELAVAAAAGKLGSMDVNRGDLLLGWDTYRNTIGPLGVAWTQEIVPLVAMVLTVGLVVGALLYRRRLETALCVIYTFAFMAMVTVCASTKRPQPS